jgi:hypothetical protein
LPWPHTAFRAWDIFFDMNQRSCTSRETAVPATTGLVGSYGSGKESAERRLREWQQSDSAGRSRAILSSFCDSINSGNDPLSGGPPQVVALYTQGPPVQIGMLLDGRRYINGLEVNIGPHLRKIEWRDSLGQIVDPITGNLLPGARRFACPAALQRPSDA